MAVEKLSDGIRKFSADAIKLETMIKVRHVFVPHLPLIPSFVFGPGLLSPWVLFFITGQNAQREKRQVEGWTRSLPPHWQEVLRWPERGGLRHQRAFPPLILSHSKELPSWVDNLPLLKLGPILFLNTHLVLVVKYCKDDKRFCQKEHQPFVAVMSESC